MNEANILRSHKTYVMFYVWNILLIKFIAVVACSGRKSIIVSLKQGKYFIHPIIRLEGFIYLKWHYNEIKIRLSEMVIKLITDYYRKNYKNYTLSRMFSAFLTVVGLSFPYTVLLFQNRWYVGTTGKVTFGSVKVVAFYWVFFYRSIKKSRTLHRHVETFVMCKERMFLMNQRFKGDLHKSKPGISA